MKETDKNTILNELKNVLKNRYQERDSISLYDVKNIIFKKRDEYEQTKDNINEIFDTIVEKNINSDSFTCIYNFDYEKKLFCFGFKWDVDDEWDDLSFSKEKGEIYSQTNKFSSIKNKCLTTLGNQLINAYDSLIKYKDFFNQNSFNIKSTNSIFKVDISSIGVSVDFSTFEIHYSSYNDTYTINMLFEKIEKDIDAIFKNIFVCINDCPKWLQEELNILRNKQLKKEDRLEKILTLKDKIFPWAK